MLQGGRFLVERCDQCMGLFFDPGELEALLEATVANVFEINRKQLDSIGILRNREYGVTYIRCPVCTGVMNRVNFGARSGVIVDRCKEHGVWLDGGELRHLFEWMKAGGKLLDQQRQEERRKTEAAHELKRHSQYTVESLDQYPDFDSFGGTLRKSDPDLFDVVKSAVRFFLK
jgi:Zn-finger nucleic acid-binding protein